MKKNHYCKLADCRHTKPHLLRCHVVALKGKMRHKNYEYANHEARKEAKREAARRRRGGEAVSLRALRLTAPKTFSPLTPKEYP